MRTASGVEMWQPNAEARDLTQDQMVANLRVHGCPEHLALRVVEKRFKSGYGRKVAVAGTPTADLADKIAVLRRVARSMAKSVLAIAERDCGFCAGGGDDQYSSKMIRGHLAMASQLIEAAASTAETIENIFNDPETWPDYEDDSARGRTPSATYQSDRKKADRRKFREMHRECHRLLGELSLQHAQTRLTAGEIFD